MTLLPSVIHADYQGQFRIRITFNDLSERTVDFRPWLEGPVFEALKDPAYFRQFFLDGGTVVWPNGADIAPETLYAAVTGRGEITAPKSKRRQLTQRATAKTRAKPAKARAGRRTVR